MFSRTKIRLIATGVALMAALGSAQAASTQLTAVPTAWRIENYAGGSGGANVVLWYTGATCANNGGLTLSAPSEGDKNRFFAIVLAAKLASHAMFVYYDTTTCVISSFGMDG